MKNEKNILIYLIIAITYIVVAIVSFIIKKDLLILISTLFIGIIFIAYVFISESRLLYTAIIVSIVAPFLSQYIGIAAQIPQVFFVLLLFRLMYKVSFFKINLKKDNIISLLLISTIILSTISYIFFVKFNISLYIWASLKRYGFFIVFLYVYNMENSRKISDKLIKIFMPLIIFQIFATLIQFYEGINGDHITGIFGLFATGEYSHFLLVVFIVLICKKERSLTENLFIGVLLIHICSYAAIAEVKMIFFVLPIIVILFNILNKSVKGFFYILIFTLIFITGIYIYNNIYSYNDIQNKDFINSYLTGDYGDVKLNRFNFMSQLESQVFTDDIQILIGAGIGAAHPSKNLEILKGPIYKNNSELKLDWFTLPYLITETGIIGTILYLLIYVYIFIIGLKQYIQYREKELILLSILCMITIIYNSTLVSSYRVIIITWFYITTNWNKKLNCANYNRLERGGSI